MGKNTLVGIILSIGIPIPCIIRFKYLIFFSSADQRIVNISGWLMFTILITFSQARFFVPPGV